jgi:hypothetical protein
MFKISINYVILIGKYGCDWWFYTVSAYSFFSNFICLLATINKLKEGKEQFVVGNFSSGYWERLNLGGTEVVLIFLIVVNCASFL